MMGRKAVLAFSITAAKQAVGFVGLFFVARLMGPDALGMLGFVFAYVGLFNFLSDMGFNVAHMKKVSEGNDPAACLGTFLVIRLVLTAAMVIAVGVAYHWFPPEVSDPVERLQQTRMLWLAVGSMAVINLTTVLTTTYAARLETAKQTLPEFIGKVVEVCLKVLAAVLGLSVVMLAGATLAGAVVWLMLCLVLFRGEPIGRPDWKLAGGYLAFALPVMVLVSANAVTENLDKVMVRYFWSPEEVGYYVGAGRIAAVLWLAGIPIGTPLFPRISELHAQGNVREVRALTVRAERFLGLLLIPVGVLLTVLAVPAVHVVLGKPFTASSSILALLGWAAIFRVVSNPFSAQIIGVDRPGLSARLSVLVMVLNVVLNLVLVPRELAGIPMAGLGAQGAALATMIAALVMAGVYRGIAVRLTHTRSDGMAWLRQLLAAAVMTACLVVVITPEIRSHLGWSLLTAMGGGVVYVLALVVLREIGMNDYRYFMRILSPRHMLTYMRDELGRSSSSAPDPDSDEGND